ncbi:MAG: DUF465 domain-containing protein [Blastocatellia bacterium]
MSVSVDESSLKELLIQSNDHYRQLHEEHHRYDERLSQLAAIHFPNEEEKLEELTLKKKKLSLKDQMEAIFHEHKASIVTP